MKGKSRENRKGTGTPAARRMPWRHYLAQYWQFYVMAAVPLVYFILFKWMPVLGNVLAFRRYRPPALSPAPTASAGWVFAILNSF